VLEAQGIYGTPSEVTRCDHCNHHSLKWYKGIYIESLVEIQQREPERWEIAETLMTLAQTLTDLANDANPVSWPTGRL
jgi:hypothetical protein